MFYLFVTLIVIVLLAAYLFIQGSLGININSNRFYNLLKVSVPANPFTPSSTTPPSQPIVSAPNTQMKQGDVLVIVGDQHRILSLKQIPEVIIGHDPSQSDMITSYYCSRQHCHLTILPNGQLHVNIPQSNSNGTWQKVMTANGESDLFEITGMEENIILPDKHLPVYLLLSSPEDEVADVVTLIKL